MSGPNIVVPLMAWGVVLSFLVIGYLMKLSIREYLCNRRLNAQRQRLGLPPV